MNIWRVPNCKHCVKSLAIKRNNQPSFPVEGRFLILRYLETVGAGEQYILKRRQKLNLEYS